MIDFLRNRLNNEINRLKALTPAQRKISVETYREVIVGTIIGAFGNLFIYPSFLNALTLVAVLYACRIGLSKLEELMKD